MIYVGQIKPHKNLPRAVQAFYESKFCEQGGVFTILAGGASSDEEMRELRRLSMVHSEIGVQILPRCSDAELDELFASATMLIQPSLEEGFGLPVIEALAGGLPVCCSDIAALREAGQGKARTFNPLLVASIRDAIDQTALDAERGQVPDAPQMPTLADFAREFVALVEQTARRATR
jgi:glycosyltransferase involved in cell wall biosynthesis